MADKIGFDCKTYVDASGVGGSTWAEVDKVGDVDPTDEAITADVNDRRVDVVTVVVGRKRVSYEFNLSHVTDDAQYQALRDAYHSKTVIGIAFMDGAIATVGSEGWQFDARVTMFSRPEELDGHVVRRVRVQPAADYGTAPAYVEVST